MSPAHDPEQDLGETLARQADRFAEHGSHLELDQVLSRAGEIRRGRRMRATMVMAAVVLAVAVPVGITTLGDPTKASDNPPVLSTPSPTPNLSRIGLDDLDTGAEPARGYVLDGQLRLNGSTVRLGDGLPPYSVARISGGYLVGRPTATTGGVTISVIADAQNGTEMTWESESAILTVSPGGNVGAFVDNNNTLIAVQDGGTRHYELATMPNAIGYQIIAITGENCDPESAQVDCTVYVELSFPSDPSQTWVFSPNADPKRVFTDLLTVADVSADGWVAAQISSSDDGSCWEVQDPQGVRAWETCEHSLDAFSPDGRYLVAGPAYRSGAGDSSLAILDVRTGVPVLELDARMNAFVGGSVWEDATHILVPVFDTGTWAVQRIALDGSREYATEQATDAEDAYISPFTLL